MSSFTLLGLSKAIVDVLIEQGYENPTPIQQQAIPKALAGHDILATAQTGTGKTAAFMLPSLERLSGYANHSTSPAMHPVRMLVLVPTRDLADQVSQNVELFTKNIPLRHMVIWGGLDNRSNQAQDLHSGCEIVVSTTGRLLDHIKQKNIQFNHVEIVVLDEADRMLDNNFIDDIRQIMNVLPKKKQILLFSATFSPKIHQLANDLMVEPEVIEVAPRNIAAENIDQLIYAVDYHKKYHCLEKVIGSLINDFQKNQLIVFCNTKASVDYVTRQLVQSQFKAQAIHGDKSQLTRIDTLSAFKLGDTQVLVATDIAGRGLDIEDLPCVVNYELPSHTEDYVHRIGRTGRAGAKGLAVSLVDESDIKILQSIRELTKAKLPLVSIKGFEASWYRNPQASIKPKDKSNQYRLAVRKQPSIRKIQAINHPDVCEILLTEYQLTQMREIKGFNYTPTEVCQILVSDEIN